MNITSMEQSEVLALTPEDVNHLLTPDELVHIATVLGAFWLYDYDAAKQGKVGLHAKLKSERHSDGFFVSRILLEQENIRKVIATQMVRTLRDRCFGGSTDWVAGIPDGATSLGEEVRTIIGGRCARMEKVDGKITLITPIGAGEKILLVEDFCTRGTGFSEAVVAVKNSSPEAVLCLIDLVILNRGGLKEVVVPNHGNFAVVAVVEKRIQDWAPEECPLCKLGSAPIKPKATDENWKALIASQR